VRIKKLKYIDLFSGCGGLSLGLEKAGFELVLAVEKSDMAAETFYHNFIERITEINKWKEFASANTPIEKQAEKKLVIKELGEVLECKPLIQDLKKQSIDLVAGGPPCQGFSLAGRRNPDDLRNQLPWQFLEFVDAIQPKAVLIENVSGMSQAFLKHGKSSPFNDLRLALIDAGTGYKVQPLHLNAKHFGAPQNRPRVMLLAIRNDVATKLDLKVSPDIWKSEYDHIESTKFKERPSLAPIATYFGSEILSVKDAIFDLDSQGYNRRNKISKYAVEMRDDLEWMPINTRQNYKKHKLTNHKTRKHSAQIQTRFRIYQLIRDEKLSTKALSIPKDDKLTESGQRISIKEIFAKTKFPAVAPDGCIIANSVDELVDLVMQLGTKKHSQRPLNWELPSPTVVSLPDDYVHPSEARTLTVRELARFQSFPDAFEFRAKETTGSLRRRYEVPQYTQVGNAVPPKLSFAVGVTIKDILKGVTSL